MQRNLVRPVPAPRARSLRSSPGDNQPQARTAPASRSGEARLGTATRRRRRALVPPAAAPVAEIVDTSDEAVFARYAATGCEASFQMIHARYRSRIRGFLLRRVGDVDVAEDLTQNVFVRIVRARASFDPRRNFSTWSHTIASNLLKNHYRTVSRSRVHSFTYLESTAEEGASNSPYDVPSTAPTPDEEAYRAQMSARLDAALQSIPEVFRVPFRMHEVDGETYDVVSERLGVPVGTVKSRMYRARAQLKRSLAAFSTEAEDPGIPV